MQTTNVDTDILIVGAGLAGASTAHHLRRRGSRDVVIVEREESPGVHSSGRNAALVRTRISDTAVAAMAEEGAEALRPGRLAPFHQTGSLLLGLGDDEASRFCPPVRGRGLWCPGDGTIEVTSLLQRFLAGQSVHFSTEVQSIDRSARSLRVRTTRGTITCRVLVNAAGPWAGRIGDLDLTPMNRHLFITPPRPDIPPDWPFVWDDSEGFYFRPESGGLLLCACDESAAEPGDYREDPRVLDRLCEIVPRLQPGLGELAIMNQWVGQRTFARDRRFVIGFDPRDDRVFHVAGLGGHGVTCSPAIGRLAADLLLNGVPAQPNPFDPARLMRD